MLANRFSRRGLSAVELAVVVGIVAIVFSLLFPALQQARHSALKNDCQNNLRRVWLGLASYRAANDDRFPTAPRQPSLEPDRHSLPQVLFEYVNRDVAVFRCPMDPKYFREEGTSYEYPQPTLGPSGQTLAELQKVWQGKCLSRIQLTYDFEPTEHSAHTPTDRSILFADGHIK